MALINDLRWQLHDLWPEAEIPPRIDPPAGRTAPPARPRFPPPPDKRTATASTAAATVSSTARFTDSRSPRADWTPETIAYLAASKPKARPPRGDPLPQAPPRPPRLAPAATRPRDHHPDLRNPHPRPRHDPLQHADRQPRCEIEATSVGQSSSASWALVLRNLAQKRPPPISGAIPSIAYRCSPARRAFACALYRARLERSPCVDRSATVARYDASVRHPYTHSDRETWPCV